MRTFRNTVMADIEQSGGRVKKHTVTRIKAVAPRSYVEDLNTMRDRPDTSEHRNSRYVEWVEEFAARQDQGSLRASQGEWIEFTVYMKRKLMPGPISSKTLVVATTAAILATLMSLITACARPEIESDR